MERLYKFKISLLLDKDFKINFKQTTIPSPWELPGPLCLIPLKAIAYRVYKQIIGRLIRCRDKRNSVKRSAASCLTLDGDKCHYLCIS